MKLRRLHAAKLLTENITKTDKTGNEDITLNDPKKNFGSHHKCHLVNPAKSELGKVSKVIIDSINDNIRSIIIRSMKKFSVSYRNVNAFNHDLSEIFNLYSPASNDPNELWGDFKFEFLRIADKHAPVKQRRIKTELKPWITSEIKYLIYHRDYLKRQAIRLRSVYYETAYKKCKNKITNLIRTSKENYFKAKLSDSKNSKES